MSWRPAKERLPMNTINLALYAASIAMPNVNETNLPSAPYLC
jgi:hypothetical protein